MNAYLASSTALGGDVASAVFEGGIDILEAVLPYLIGFGLIWFAVALAKRVLGGA